MMKNTQVKPPSLLLMLLLGITLVLVIYGSLSPTGMRFLPWYRPNLMHVLVYALIAFLMVCSCHGLRGGFWIAVMLAFTFGLVVEMAQYFIPMREARLGDMLFNLFGVAIGGVMALILNEQSRRLRMVRFPRLPGLNRGDVEHPD